MVNADFTGDDKPRAFLERLLDVFTAFFEPFLKQREPLRHRYSTWPVLNESFYLLDECWMERFSPGEINPLPIAAKSMV